MKTRWNPLNRMAWGLALALGTLGAAQATAVITLPTSGLDIGPQVYHDALVFSSSLLAQQQANGLMPGNTSNFLFASGSGTLPVTVYNGNNSPNPSPFAPSMSSPSNATNFSGTWGVGYSGTIGALRQFLTVNGTQYQPLFAFDHNDGSTIGVKGSVSVYSGNVQGDTWYFDDNGAPVISCPKVNIGPTQVTGVVTDNKGDTCNIQAPTFNNVTYSWDTKGSGKSDYYGVFTGFNLYDAKYSDSDSIVVDMSLFGLTGGFEELSIAGYLFDTPTHDTPEPASLALFSLALLGLAVAGRVRKH